jgi:hypothetical protein
MTVMGIMVIIVSAIVVAAYGVQRQGQIKGSKGLLEQLALALENYRAQYRMYVPRHHNEPTVPNPVTVATDPWQVECSSAALWMALEHVEKIDTAKKEYKEKGGTFTSPETGALVDVYFYRDAWRQPIMYECYPPYTRFTLTSFGPDLVPGGDTRGDDIVVE